MLESIYEECLCAELKAGNLAFARQVAAPVSYKGRPLECTYRMDPVIEASVIAVIKCVEQRQPVHKAQLLTYMRLSGLPIGCCMKIKEQFLRDGIRRLSLARKAQT